MSVEVTVYPESSQTPYTDEQAQDAVGSILTDSSTVDFTYNDGANTITASVIAGGIDHNSLANLTTGDPHTQYVVAEPSSTDNAVVRWDSTTGRLVQNSVVIIGDTGIVTGVEEMTVNTRLEVGDPGTESTGVNIGGTTYGLGLRVNDIGGGRQGQIMMHRHSTAFGSLIFGSRSNSDTTAHSAVTNDLDLMGIVGVGYVGSFYGTMSAIKLKSGATGTISDTSWPGAIEFYTVPDGSTTLTSRGKIRQDGTWEIGGATISSAGAINTTSTLNVDYTAQFGDLVFIATLGGNGVVYYDATGLTTDVSSFNYDSTYKLLNLGSQQTLYTAYGTNNSAHLGVWRENKAFGETSVVFGAASSTASRSNIVDFIRCTGAAMGSGGISAANTSLGLMRFGGWDGVSQYRQAASIEILSDGSYGAASSPGKIVIGTTAFSSVTPTTRLTIDSTGLFTFQTGTISSAGVGSAWTQWNVDNVRLDGNTLSSTSGALILDAAATGIQMSDPVEMSTNAIKFGGSNQASMFWDTGLVINPKVTGSGLLTIGSATGTANADLNINKLSIGNSGISVNSYVNGVITGSGRGILAFTLTFTGAGSSAVITQSTLVDQGTSASFTGAAYQAQVKTDTSNHTNTTMYGCLTQMGWTTNFTASTGTHTAYGHYADLSTFGVGASNTGGTFRRYGFFQPAMTAIAGSPGSDLIMGSLWSNSMNFLVDVPIIFDSTTTALGDTTITYVNANTDLEVKVDGTATFTFDNDKTYR
jgi:hypothetical protein